MNQSDNIADLATALSKAQSEIDTFSESKLIPRILGKKFKSNRHDGKSYIIRFFEKIAYGISDCWFWIGSQNKHGYGQVGLLGENKAHRLSWILFKGEIPKGLKVLHKCDIRNCVNPNHLFLGTQIENIRDMDSKGRRRPSTKSAEKNPMSKLDRNLVKEMRLLYSDTDLSYKNIGKIFGISTMTAFRAIKNISWSTI